MLFVDIASGVNAQGLFDKTCALQMVKHTQFDDIISRTHALQSADLIQMDGMQRKCFYGNLLSLMTIHCFMNHFHKMGMQVIWRLSLIASLVQWNLTYQ